MRVPIQIIGVAASVFWVFLIIFSASAIYSMEGFRVKLGQLQTSTTEDHELLVSYPVSVVNTGLYEVANFNMSTSITDNEGLTVAVGSTLMPVIGPSQAMNFTQDMMLNVTDLLKTHQSLLYNDTELGVNTTVSMVVAEAIPVIASSNSSVPWGAPLYNFDVGTPQFAMYNTTHSCVIVPLSFENHAFFDLAGTLWLRAYCSTLIGQGQTQIEAPQHSSYSGTIEVYVPSGQESTVRLELSFVTSFFDLELEVTPRGS
jgi:hypothetical protein